MIKPLLGHLWVSPTFLLHGWIPFFQEEFHKLLVLHAIIIIGSYGINIFHYFSLWQISLFIILLRKLMAGGVCHSRKNLHGNVVIVTGACSGIGKETTKNLALRGAKIIMACCEIKRANEVSQEIRSETGADITVMELDLSSLQSVRSFVKEFRKNHNVLHILINNAGIMMCPYELTEDGFERQFAVNHLGHFLLTNLLLPTMIGPHQARIVNLSSIIHLAASLDLTKLNDAKGYNAVLAYGNCKLANILFSVSLKERLKETNVKVFAVHPGVVQSPLWHYVPFSGYVRYSQVASVLFKSPSQAAQTTLYCALEAESSNSCYFSDCGVGYPSSASQDKVLAKKLWKISEEFVSLQRSKDGLESHMRGF